MQLKDERLLRTIVEGKLKQHALSHSKEWKQKACCDELSQSLDRYVGITMPIELLGTVVCEKKHEICVCVCVCYKTTATAS